MNFVGLAGERIVLKSRSRTKGIAVEIQRSLRIAPEVGHDLLPIRGHGSGHIIGVIKPCRPDMEFVIPCIDLGAVGMHEHAAQNIMEEALAHAVLICGTDHPVVLVVCPEKDPAKGVGCCVGQPVDGVEIGHSHAGIVRRARHVAEEVEG